MAQRAPAAKATWPRTGHGREGWRQDAFVQGAADQKIRLADRPAACWIGWQVHSCTTGVLGCPPLRLIGAHAVGGSVARAAKTSCTACCTPPLPEISFYH